MELVKSITTMRETDLQDPNIIRQKQQQMTASLAKFKKHFGQNLEQLTHKEKHKQVSPKFTVCFMDLAKYLGLHLDPSTPASNYVGSLEGHYQRAQPSIIKEEEEQDYESNGELERGHISITNEEEMSTKLKQKRRSTPMQEVRAGESMRGDVNHSMASIGYSDISQ